jgi:microcystin-dependent protein
MADQIGTVPGAGPLAINRGNRGILNSWGVTAFGGEANHQISVAEMPGHNHPGSSDSGHGHGASQDDHTHNFQSAIGSGSGLTSGGAYFSLGNITTSGASANGVYVQTGYANITVGSQGGWAAHNNVQPTTTVMKMIKW